MPLVVHAKPFKSIKLNDVIRWYYDVTNFICKSSTPITAYQGTNSKDYQKNVCEFCNLEIKLIVSL